jgi:molybdopterin converting factor small subunit
MSSLRVLNSHGDHHVSWSPEALARGDPEAQAAVREAERIFARERQRGSVAFRVLPGALSEKIEVLDPSADEIVILPPMAGG